MLKGKEEKLFGRNKKKREGKEDEKNENLYLHKRLVFPSQSLEELKESGEERNFNLTHKKKTFNGKKKFLSNW